MSEGRFKLGTGSPVYEGFYLSPAPRFQHNMDCTPTTTLQNQTLGPSVPTTGHQCQEAVLLASQDNWQITGSFSTTVCQTVYSVTQKSRPLQHSVLWKENKVYQVPLFILSSRLLFFILLAFQHVLECAAGNGSERKGQKLPLEAGSHDCRVSYVMPEGVMPSHCGTLEPGLSLRLGQWYRKTYQRASGLFWDPPRRLQRVEWKYDKVERG